ERNLSVARRSHLASTLECIRMSQIHRCGILMAFLACVVPDRANADQPAAPSATELAATLRDLLLHNLPDPLVQQQQNWGKQVARPSDGKKVNQGVWRKIRVTALDPANTLNLQVRNVQQAEPNRTTFDVNADFNAQIDFEHQVWVRGARVYSGSSRARAKVHVALECDVNTRVETDKGLLPDIVFRWKVTKANLTYSGLDFIHVAGVGGDGADALGKGLMAFLKAVRPNMERDLLARANAAIVTAGDNNE